MKLAAISAGVLLAGDAYGGRNSSGTMSFTSVPGGYPNWIPGQAITSSGLKQNFAELGTELTDSLSRTGKGGMTAPLRCADGSVSLPAFTWTSETSSGLYRIGSGDVGLSILGTKRWEHTVAGQIETGWLQVAGTTTVGGKLTAPSFGPANFDAASFVSSVTVTGFASFLSSVTVPTPAASTDAANKAYVDAQLATTTGTKTMSTGWTDAGGVVSLNKSGKVVHLSFAVSNTGSGTWSMFTLPTGFVPGPGVATVRLIASAYIAGAYKYVQVVVYPVTYGSPGLVQVIGIVANPEAALPANPVNTDLVQGSATFIVP
jgi:hypothetical protein